MLSTDSSQHFHAEGKSLPWNVVYDCENIEGYLKLSLISILDADHMLRLSEFLTRWQGVEERDENGMSEMLELVDRYSNIREAPTWQLNRLSSSSNSSVLGEVVVSRSQPIFPSLVAMPAVRSVPLPLSLKHSSTM